jgi:hypothetical protein
MSGQFNHHLAQQRTGDRLRVERTRRGTALVADAHHVRQRERVRASLLLSPRPDRPTHRRWA